MRLGFYYHIPAIEKEGGVHMPGYLGRFIDSLAGYCEGLYLFLHLPNIGEKVNVDYRIKSGNVSLISLPPRESVPHRFIHSRQYTKVIKEHLSGLNAMLLRGPSPLVPPVAKIATQLSVIFLIVGDQLAGVDSLPQPSWRKELIRIWSWYNAQRQYDAARNSLVFVNSMALYKQFAGRVANLQETRTTTLNIADLYYREDTCQSRPINILFTGRLDPAKGLLDIVEAVSLLVRQGEDIVLNFVGWAEQSSTILADIKRLAEKNRIIDRIIFHGYKPVGPELFNFYKNADVYVIASQSSEGFPRTIWEAMAHCLPVVATRVGSIPDFITGAAELVEPRNPEKLADGISRIINNKLVRQKYISTGFMLARKNTLEYQVGQMSNEIVKWITNKNA